MHETSQRAKIHGNSFRVGPRAHMREIKRFCDLFAFFSGLLDSRTGRKESHIDTYNCSNDADWRKDVLF